MKISAGENPGTVADPPNFASNSTTNERAATATPAPASAASTAEKTPARPGTSVATPTTTRQTAVTFRRDDNGRVYYVVSDAHTGEEILEVPPKAVRDVGQGIEDYVKNEESKAAATPRIAVKA
ncbi:MAG: hypothetical protein ABSH13_11950 [Candidatus Acidiferrum sp.]